MNSTLSLSFYNEPSYSDLPMEIILQILDYLDTSDLYAASLTCRHWFNAAQHKNFTSKQIISFSKIQLIAHEQPLRLFENNLRHYNCIKLAQLDVGEMTDFWNRFSQTIDTIQIENCDIHEKILVEILTTLHRIRELCIDNCRELFMTGRLFDNVSDKQNLCATCKNILTLRLTNNRYLSDALFLRFIAIMPKLQTIDLSGCPISFHHGLYKKFYPQTQSTPSESVLTFHWIGKVLEQQASTVQHLNFSSTLIDGTALIAISNMANLKLTTIHLRSCDQLTNAGIISIVQAQTELQELDLSFSVRLTDAALLIICQSLAKPLKVLKLRRCRAVTDMSVKQIAQLIQLQCLDISECELLSDKGIVEGFAKQTNKKMEKLYLSALNISTSTVQTVAEYLPNLRVLDLSFCKTAVTDLAIGTILSNLCWLRELNVEYCDLISDAGLTGLNLNNNPNLDNLSISSSSSSEIDALPTHSSFNSGQFKISLRSKAEQIIVDEAQRKKFMIKLYETNPPLLQDLITSSSIDNVKGLKKLNLTACNRITDVSLKYTFHLNELKELNLTKCSQISIVGLKTICVKCPSIEVLHLSECDCVDDKAIKLLTEHLHRLRQLYLERCIQLTDYALDYIALNCHQLKYLDIRGCRSMSSEPQLRLAHLTTLRNVVYSKPGPYLPHITNILKQSMRSPLSPPLPPPLPYHNFAFF